MVFPGSYGNFPQKIARRWRPRWETPVSPGARLVQIAGAIQEVGEETHGHILVEQTINKGVEQNWGIQLGIE